MRFALCVPSSIVIGIRLTRASALLGNIYWTSQETSVAFRAMLWKGNHRPAPGPNRWEKWIIKNLSDNALALVLDLHNYIVMNARFPGDLKDMWLTYMHKREVHTNLLN